MTDFESRNGNIVIGVMLVAIGLVAVLSRAGVVVWNDQWSIWPLILFGIGLAHFVQTPAGLPRRGLVFMVGGAWLFAGQANWISLGDSWPVLVIAVGLIIAFNSGRRTPSGSPPGEPGAALADTWAARRTRRHQRGLSGLAILGVWMAIVAGTQMSGVGFPRSIRDGDPSEHGRVVSVMGRTEYVSRTGSLTTLDVSNVMGRTEIDLRSATIPPGGEAVLQVFSAMGAVIVRVPADWTVDTRAMPTLGAVRDQRPRQPSTSVGEPAPRLVLRGMVVMGRMTIAS